jgi:iron complex transport system substrate-binding protein
MHRAVLAFLLVCPLLAGEAQAGPSRVVSLNLCADQLVLRLLSRERIASLTWLARDPFSSTMAQAATGIPANSGGAEEVAGFRPDLVVAGVYTTRTTVGFLRRAGQPVLELGVPDTFDQARGQITELAGALGVSERGREVVAEMTRRLDAVAAVPEASRLRAVILGPYGFAVGPGSVLDEVITRAGFVNLAAGVGTPGAGQISLETALLARPDVIILDADPERGPALAAEIARHPILRKLHDRIAVVSLPSRLWTCAGPQLADAVELLDRERARISAARARVEPDHAF